MTSKDEQKNHSGKKITRDEYREKEKEKKKDERQNNHRKEN